MPEAINQSLPFVTRDMLDYKHGARFQLRITSRSFSATIMKITGTTKAGYFTYRHTLVNTNAQQTQVFGLADIPIWVAVSADVGDEDSKGQTFVAVDLMIDGNVMQNLCAGYLSFQHGISWPATRVEDTTLGIGLIKSYTGANPGAGAETSITIPDGVIVKVMGWRATLVAAAAAASRRVHLIFTTIGPVLDAFSLTDQIISETKVYSGQVGYYGTAYTNDNDIILPLPQDLYLQGTDTVTTATFNLNAGDDWGVPVLYVQEWKL